LPSFDRTKPGTRSGAASRFALRVQVAAAEVVRAVVVRAIDERAVDGVDRFSACPRVGQLAYVVGVAKVKMARSSVSFVTSAWILATSAPMSVGPRLIAAAPGPTFAQRYRRPPSRLARSSSARLVEQRRQLPGEPTPARARRAWVTPPWPEMV
jgi:hypothetical protein